MTDFFFCDTNGTAPGLLCLRRFDSLKNNKYILKSGTMGGEALKEGDYGWRGLKRGGLWVERP